MLLKDIREMRALMRQRLEARTKGGPGSGHHGHAGRPGQVGGSTAGTGGVSVAAHAKSPIVTRGSPEDIRPYLAKTVAGGFDHEAEHLALYPEPPKYSGDTPKESVSRSQIEVFYKRKNAVEAAMREGYAGEAPGSTIRDWIDSNLESGLNKVKIAGPRKDAVLYNDETELRVKDVVGKRYLLTALNMGEFKKNY